MTHKLKKNKGFTLVELIVVIAIMLMMSAIILFNYAGFNSSVSLDNLSQDIALSIRKAQMSAVSVKSIIDANTTNTIFPSGFGVHFETGANNNGTPEGGNKSFIFFADIDNVNPAEKRYDQISPTCDPSNLSSSNECMDIMNIKSSDEISEICIKKSGEDLFCPPFNQNPKLDIIFTRPNLDAKFCFTSSPNSSCESNVSFATIRIQSSRINKSKEITVQSTGQISVSGSSLTSPTTPICSPPQILSGNNCITPIVSDTIPPEITLWGDDPLSLTVTLGGTFIDPGATAFDVFDNSSVLVTSVSTVNIEAPGTYTIEYTAIDSHNNPATKTRTVIVTLP